MSDLIRALKAKPSQDVVWSAGHPTKDGARVKASNAARGRHSAWRGVDVAQFVFYHQEAADGTWSVVVGLARPEAPKPAAKRRRGR